ncbi:MAG TPA: fused MFS/spermidine synthase [Myxococcales bacterium]|nr:fused MFS/spermidine synthase [Myxococcales bacterium]
MAPWFVWFALSGFCSLLYETLWLRLSMAQFGVTSPALAILLSVFMAGLALGSWLVSRSSERLARLDPGRGMRAYAFTELGIAVLALPAPWLLRAGGSLLASALAGKGAVAWYAAALGWQALVLLPASTLMGATIPVGMLAIRRAASFSYLYLANVLGAAFGTLLSAFVLIELLGFTHTLLVATAGNLVIALLALSRATKAAAGPQAGAKAAMQAPEPPSAGVMALVLLFFSGFCSMGIEVVWTRQFTPYLGTVVYAFALVLAVYLVATFAGSALYRRLKARSPSALSPAVVCSVALAGALALLAADVSHLGSAGLWEKTGGISVESALRVALGVAPFSALLGLMTPQLVDRWSGGDGKRAGLAYAVNTVGCILGPLAAGFVMLPNLSERTSLLWLCAPFAIAGLALVRRPMQLAGAGAALAVAAGLAFGTRGYLERIPREQLMRDHTATTAAFGQGMQKRLLVNGIGMTVLTPITKMMAHLPSALLPNGPRNALVICFGMGTSFRSLRTWDIPVTAVELVPGVPRLFGYFHADAQQVLSSPDAHVVIDDGRRFLETTTTKYDVIVIDPPPPVQAASSSLLYSKEFYALVKAHLAPGGILQQWYPGGDRTTQVAFVRALAESFAHLRAFAGYGFGVHLLASDSPLEVPSAEVLASRLPPKAARDLVEWGPREDPVRQFADTLARPLHLEQLLERNPAVDGLEDDRPVNEYYLLRTLSSSDP